MRSENLEQVRPFVGIRKIVAQTHAAINREIERCRQYQKPLGVGVTFKCNAKLLANGRTPAVTRDEIPSPCSASATIPLDLNRHRRRMVDKTDHTRAHHHRGARERRKPPDTDIGYLVLLALHNEWKLRILRENLVVELGDPFAGNAIPE